MKYYALLSKVALLVLVSRGLSAQESLVTPVTRTFVLTNVNIVQKPGQVISLGAIVVRDGLIQEVGKTVTIPANARIIQADSMYVYAGFIDGLSHTGVPRTEQQAGQQGRQGPPAQQVKDPGNPPNDVAGIQPEIQVKDLLNAGDKAIEDWRKAGFTAVHVVPRGNMLPGSGAIILTNGSSNDQMVLRNQTSLFSQLSGARQVYPSTVIAVMSKWRELYKRAEQAKAHEAMYAKNPAGLARPNYDRTLQSFYPIIDKKMPVFFAANDMKSVHRIYTLQNELKFPLVLADLKQGWHVADLIQSKGTPVFLTLDLPKEKKKDDKKKDDKKELSVTEKEMEILEARSSEELKKHLEQAGLFEKKGIEFGFSALTAKPNEVRENIRKMIENGLSENTALAALTTTPAKLLGVSNMMGTVERGKIANLVVTDNPYFAEKANVRYVFVDGHLFEYEAPPAKKPGEPGAAPAKVAGKWSYTVKVPGQSSEGLLELKTEGDNVSGTISNPQTGQMTAIANPELKGKELSFSVTYNMGPQTITVSFEVEVDGDTFAGNATVGQFGSFPVEGSRIPN